MYIRILLLLASFSTAFQLSAQDYTVDALEIIEEDLPTGDVKIYAVFKGYCPITLTIDFPELNNFKPTEELPFQAIVQPGGKKQELVFLQRIKKTSTASYGFSYGFTIGDGMNAKHDNEHVYQLPFPKGSKYLMGQGNNGRFSHHGLNAVDFNMPVGSKVAAARAGTVVDYRETSSAGCKSPDCQDAANYILIYHEDGSFGHYGHLQKNGVLVELGQQVKAGDIIGKSGNTGWSSGPHLHFEVYVPSGNKQITIPVNFLLNGKKGQLKEGEFYTSSGS